MSDNPALPEFKWAPGFSEVIAQIANNWAHIEFALNQSIWLLAGIADDSGACITSQIFTVQGRLSAIKSLLDLRGDPKHLISKVNKFSESIRNASRMI
jgi:hypothetical protein